MAKCVHTNDGAAAARHGDECCAHTHSHSITRRKNVVLHPDCWKPQDIDGNIPILPAKIFQPRDVSHIFTKVEINTSV
jgi:hypothetical protein